MSSSIAAASTSVSAMNTAASNVLSSLPGSRPLSSQQQPAAAAIPTITAQFREIHKNTWLKRLTAEGKKICVGPKKSERSWVVFCVHDDTEALLEGYAEPRQAPSHNPEWVVSMKDTLHISHALIPNSHEFEFVVTLSTEVVRVHAMSWDIMQEWVETLRSKLREMKILSPRENLYTKLPEVRAPLLPTRDPTSPLPAPPPVPAAIVPGVERVIPHGVHQPTTESFLQNTDARNSVNNLMSSLISNEISINASALPETASSNNFTETFTATQATSTSTVVTPQLTAMSNTLTQNLLNMLSDPISAYSEQINDANSSSTVEPEDITGSSLSLAMDRGLNLSKSSSEEEFMAPLLRKPSANNSDSNCSSNNSVRLDVLASHRASADQIRSLENFLQCDRYIQRPQSSRSLSAGAVDKSKRQNANQNANSNIKLQSLMVSTNNGNNITELEVNSEAAIESPNTNITIIQVSTQNTSASEKNVSSNNSEYEPPSLPHKTTAITGDVFKYPDSHVSVTKNNKHLEYKSNVQIIPSSSNNSRINNINDLSSSTIKVISDSTGIVASSNQYTTPVKKQQNVVSGVASTTTKDEHSKITTVHVAGSDNTYGTCFTAPLPSASTSHTSTPKMPKKIILSANTSGITNITINNTTTEKKTEPTAGVLTKNICSDNLENDFSTVVNTDTTSFATATNLNSKNNSIHYEKVFLTTSTSASNTESNDCVQPTTSSSQNASAMSPNWNSPRHRQSKHVLKDKLPAELSLISNSLEKRVKTQKTKVNNGEHCHKSETRESMQQEKTIEHLTSSINMGSPVTIRKTFASPTTSRPTQPTLRPPFHLRRGLTEAVITSRPSRKDSHFHNKISVAKTKPSQSSSNSNASKTNMTNNNESSQLPTDAQLALNRVPSERKRSSSTSDAQAQRHIRSTNNNDPSTRMNNGSGGGGPLRQPSQPFRLTENILGVSSTSGNIGPHSTTSPAKRMTLREQQVMQLRREIMHPGGVRLQLRRKDCVGSIAWVDAFGAIWVAGWKQKEYPVLYNAVHIGDQLLSIAGNTVSSAVEANKIIRNTNTIFVEVLVRRIPFGRGYAIRREREGQCLGLIRDGNTATIVDIVPNSLAARHGLPPKAQSCDGTTLTFWVLTEINGRPLNLFFKENEIRDRLNSVGRDISILVQPSDLITKLKKQLKSLRGYKDYLVQ